MNFWRKLFNTPKNGCDKWATAETMFDGLRLEDAQAIRCLGRKIRSTVAQLAENQNIGAWAEDAAIEAIALTVLKIRTGEYQFQGFQPATFAIEIAKKRLQTFRRTKTRKPAQAMPEGFDPADDDPHFIEFENREIAEKILHEFPEPCRTILKARFLDELSDSEAIQKPELARLKNTQNLKSTRSHCLAKFGAALRQRLRDLTF